MSYRVEYYKSPIRFLWSQDWRTETIQSGVELCRHETVTPVILNVLPRNGLVLDAGCGSGRWAEFLKEHGTRTIGIDYSEEGLRLLTSQMPEASVVAGLIEQMPFRNGSFAGVLSHGVVEHIESGPRDAIAEAYRILADGGLLILVVPYNNPLRRLVVNRLHTIRRILRKARRRELAFCEYRFSAREMKRLLCGAGFEVLQTLPADLNPPKNMGLYVDAGDLFGYEPVSAGGAGKGSVLYHVVAARDQMWELSRFGQTAATVFRWLSPWFACGMALFIARARHRHL